MRARLAWFTALSAWLLATACTDDGGPKQRDMDADPSTSPEPEAGVAPDSEADAQQDASPVAPPALADQTPPTSANGLAFDAAGMLWLADLRGGQVLRFDPATGKLVDRVDQGGTAPDDVAIDEQGRVFWTAWGIGKVGRIDPVTHENVFVAELHVGANSIAFAADGRLFVGLAVAGAGLYEVDPEGTKPARQISDAFGINAFDFAPDGSLWGPTQGGVAKVDVETGDMEIVAEGPYASVRYHEADGAFYALTNGGVPRSPALDRIELNGGSVTRFAEVHPQGVDNFVSPGRPVATISNVMLEYRPGPAPRKRPAKKG